MKKNPKKTPTSTPISGKNTPSRGSLIATGAMFLIVILLWRDLSQTKKLQHELTMRNEQLGQELASVKSELKSTHDELDFFKTGDFGKTTKERSADVVPAKPVAVEEKETLFLQNPTVSETASGLVVHLQFNPADTELPGNITLVARVPGDSDAKIVSLKPTSDAGYSTVECIVDAKGKLGMIEGSPTDLKALAFALTVSAPVKATVRGSEGIKDFELDITAAGCTVRQL
jgi:hypothetical protein